MVWMRYATVSRLFLGHVMSTCLMLLWKLDRLHKFSIIVFVGNEHFDFIDHLQKQINCQTKKSKKQEGAVKFEVFENCVVLSPDFKCILPRYLWLAHVYVLGRVQKYDIIFT